MYESISDAARRVAEIHHLNVNLDHAMTAEIDGAEDFISSNAATTLADVMCQIMLARADAHTLDAEDPLIARIDAQLYSSLRALERLSGLSARELGSEFWMSQWGDPWIFPSRSQQV